MNELPQLFKDKLENLVEHAKVVQKWRIKRPEKVRFMRMCVWNCKSGRVCV